MLSPAGNEAVLLLAVHRGLITPCFSAEILEEYAAVLVRPKFGFPDEQVKALLSLLKDQGESVQLKRIPPVSPDPGDDKFIACALGVKAKFLVTGNKRHFPKHRLMGLEVVSAGELLKFLSVDI